MSHRHTLHNREDHAELVDNVAVVVEALHEGQYLLRSVETIWRDNLTPGVKFPVIIRSRFLAPFGTAAVKVTEFEPRTVTDDVGDGPSGSPW